VNILILNGSPKKRLSASRFFSNMLKIMLLGCNVTEHLIRNNENNTIFECMKTADAVILSVPLYVDSIPSHVLRFLHAAEQFCKNNDCHFKLYVISNSGFVAGHNNETHLDQYKCWCERSGIVYGGGLGIGGGVMLHVVFFVGLFLGAGGLIVKVIINIFSGADFLFDKSFAALAYRIGIWLFFSLGMLICEYRLAAVIKKGKTIKNMYTRVMVPSFVFLVFSDIFMAITALFNGKLIFSLFRKEK
jgi:hypothetical protein